jgi:hypothetical protein
LGIDLLSERARRVASVAQRLRVVQAELADHPSDERRAMMRDEIDLVLRSMVPGERKQFLFELMDSFPLFGEAPAAGAGESAGPDRATMDALAAAQAELAAAKSELSRFNDAAYVTERLVELAKRLPEEQRRAVMKRLVTAGLSEVRTVEVARKSSFDRTCAGCFLQHQHMPTNKITMRPIRETLLPHLQAWLSYNEIRRALSPRRASDFV